MLQDALRMASTTRKTLLDVAAGRRPADLWLSGANVLNVFTARLERVDVTIACGRIVALAAPLAGASKREDLGGHVLIPGLIEPHHHSGLGVSPSISAPALLGHGTTTLFEDTLPFLLDLGIDGFWPYVRALPPSPRRFWLTRLLPSSPAAAYPSVSQLEPILIGEKSAGVAEVTAWKALLDAPGDIFERLAKPLPGPVDGHLAGASKRALAQLALTGVRSCHEAITADDAFERLRLGLWTVLRQSSLRPDLSELCRLVTETGVPTDRLMLTTDGQSPDDLLRGHLNLLVKEAIAGGVPPITAVRMATLQPAMYYGIDEHLGSLAPGRLADLLVLSSLHDLAIERVYVNGQAADAIAPCAAPAYPPLRLPSRDVVNAALDAEAGDAMVLESAAITRWGCGRGPKVQLALALPDGYTNAIGYGFGDVGAIATTSTLARGLLLLGSSPDDLRLAERTLRSLCGGIVLVHDGVVELALALPEGGVMTSAPLAQVAAADRTLKRLWAEHGYCHQDPFYTLLFLTGDFLPDARLTRLGLWDVKSQTVRQPLRRMQAKGDGRVG